MGVSTRDPVRVTHYRAYMHGDLVPIQYGHAQDFYIDLEFAHILVFVVAVVFLFQALFLLLVGYW